MWKTIPGYEGFCEASEFGAIRTTPRHATTSRNLLVRGKVLTPTKTRRGYHKVTVRNASGRKTESVHALVCRAFHGQRPSASHHVNHLNGDKTDNRAENLEWATPAENSRHSTVVLGNNIGERNGNSRLSESDVRDIIDQHMAGGRCNAMAVEWGITSTQMSRILNGESWQHITSELRANVGNPLRSTRSGSFNGRAKFDESTVRAIRARHAEGCSVQLLSQEFGVPKSTTYSIVNGRTWRHVK